jgi:MFS family permease
MDRDRINFFFLNMGHFLDHFCMLVFATVAALRLTQEWNMTYSELIPYATPGFVMFGVCAIPAGWLADKWSREGMMTIFFVGIGLATILTAVAQTPLQIGIALFMIGVFAAIYHPVGIAMVVHGREKTGVPIAINGVFGNMGVAAAALVTGFLIDTTGWRMAFVVPGVVAIVFGVAYALFTFAGRHIRAAEIASGAAAKKAAAGTVALDRAVLIRVFSIIIFSTAIGGIIFHSTTFALPKIFDERLADFAGSATAVGGYAFLVFAVAAFAQLVVGYLIDHHSVRRVFAFVAALQAAFFAIMVHLTGLPALLVAFGFMLVVFGQIPINDVLVGRITRSEWRSRIYAIRYIVTLSVAATAVPLIAVVYANWGFATLFMVMAGAAGLIFTAVLFLPRTGAIMRRPATAAAE